MDVFDRAKRSQVMSRIRSEGTLAEHTLYALVRELLGARRRIDRNVNSLPGRPDLFIPSLRVAIFAHGCFYHGCAKHGRVPKSNQGYWAPKLIGNRRRDGARPSAPAQIGILRLDHLGARAGGTGSRAHAGSLGASTRSQNSGQGSPVGSLIDNVLGS